MYCRLLASDQPKHLYSLLKRARWLHPTCRFGWVPAELCPKAVWAVQVSNLCNGGYGHRKLCHPTQRSDVSDTCAISFLFPGSVGALRGWLALFYCTGNGRPMCRSLRTARRQGKTDTSRLASCAALPPFFPHPVIRWPWPKDRTWGCYGLIEGLFQET